MSVNRIYTIAKKSAGKIDQIECFSIFGIRFAKSTEILSYN
jgi:hypothetical protein